MKNALIISLNFRVSHIAHLIASYKQMDELGYNPYLYINPQLIPFLPTDVRYITKLKEIKKVEVAIFWFPALQNLATMLLLKLKYHSKILYVFHEPIEKYSIYKNLGLTNIQIISTYIKYCYTLSFLLLANAIILPSKKAFKLYKSSISVKFNKNIHYIPLLFPDELTLLSKKREYISYIGTIARDHAFEEFVKCVLSLSNDDNFPSDLKFLIATKNTVPMTEKLEQLIKIGRLKIIDGKPLTDEEINKCYSSSILVWNAYNRTTQSGVLAKASMFGTPALVKIDNLSEFSINDYNVKAIKSNTDIREITRGIIDVINNLETYSQNSRMIFESMFYYRVHNATIKSILSNL